MARKLTAAFGWRRLVETKPNARTLRSLRNFPVQTNGAEMLRLACIFASETGVKLCASLHDALFIEADEDAIDDHVHLILDRFEVGRKATYAGLTALEGTGLVTVQRHRGKNPVIRLLNTGAPPFEGAAMRSWRREGGAEDRTNI